ncbi:hypothetical protein QCA50_011452 [Cerrena zonata]|uniref:Dienelactone hydrolase domain-containing protein n=1 Tax=Cerrena zonata TaxID=2478898 RepID=A0AAW0G983_9APHY
MSCPDCVSGSIHEGTPKGKVITFANLPTYATGDESANKVIVIGCDIFGWNFVNSRLLADEYAARGFRVLLPDLFDGYELPQWTLSSRDPVNDTPSFFQRVIARPFSLGVLVPFVLRNPHATQTAKFSGIVKQLRQDNPSVKIGLVGFCWGGRYAITSNSEFDATVAAHPSLVSFPSELNKITKPISFALAETDPDYNEARGIETEKKLKARGFTDFEVVVYRGVKHGWTLRCNMADQEKKEARDKALEQVVSWFEKYLS